MIPIEQYLKDHKASGAKYSGWESGVHRLPQTPNADGTFSINYMQVKYTYPQTLAEDLERWHVLDPESNKGSYPLVSKWFSQLSKHYQRKVKKEVL